MLLGSDFLFNDYLLMSVQQPTNHELPIFEGTNIKIRHIDISKDLKRFLKADSEYRTRYKSPSNDELRDLPSGVLLTQIGIARIIRNAGPRDHLQLLYYRQPLLGNASTDYFLRTVIDNKEGKYTKDVQEYVRTNHTQIFADFPLAFQMAYDIYNTGTITDKTRKRKTVVDYRYADIMEKL
jgi:hypothetical protein